MWVCQLFQSRIQNLTMTVSWLGGWVVVVGGNCFIKDKTSSFFLVSHPTLLSNEGFLYDLSSSEIEKKSTVPDQFCLKGDKKSKQAKAFSFLLICSSSKSRLEREHCIVCWWCVAKSVHQLWLLVLWPSDPARLLPLATTASGQEDTRYINDSKLNVSCSFIYMCPELDLELERRRRVMKEIDPHSQNGQFFLLLPSEQIATWSLNPESIHISNPIR